jgi:tripartite-type tricarboxylate transporter receptor subunit TctC
MKRLGVALLILTIAASVFAGGTNEASTNAAAEYPTKAIELIVPWGAGGRTDINARMFASVAPKYLGQPVVVVNRAGGGSVIGGQYVAEAKADGYTLLAATPGTIIFPVVFDRAPYGTFDFTPIGQIGSSTMAIASNPSKPWRTVQELVEYAKTHPGDVTYACNSLTAPQLGFLRWADTAGLEFTHVPVGNDAEAVEAALGGHVDIAMTSSVATISSHVSSGNLNALMVFSERRDPALPDVPTATELGWNVVSSPFTGIAGPKDMPAEVVQKLQTTFMQVMEDPDFQTLLARIGESFDPKDAAGFEEVWRNDYDGNVAIIEKMGLK